MQAPLAQAHRSTVRTTHDASSFISIACPRTRPQACGRVWRLASCVVGDRGLTDGSRCARSRAACTLGPPLRVQPPRRRRASWSGGASRAFEPSVDTRSVTTRAVSHLTRPQLRSRTCVRVEDEDNDADGACCSDGERRAKRRRSTTRLGSLHYAPQRKCPLAPSGIRAGLGHKRRNPEGPEQTYDQTCGDCADTAVSYSTVGAAQGHAVCCYEFGLFETEDRLCADGDWRARRER